ncbi:MAG: hypothetical protein JXR51_11440 [Bacteroidales bacterium]|nr:hypothetical protein [Bacteroidales bacterium]MBN2757783.1 hypothetical protein [Bacteroidales bacterium]
MNKLAYRKLTLFLFVLLFYSNIQSQEFSKNSIRISSGIGVSMDGTTDGLGIIYSVGYQRDIWKDKFRFNPNFSIGHYSSKFVMDARDQYFNSINLQTNLFYDLIKIRAFSVVLGTGLLINNSRGLIGTGGDFEGEQSSEYFSDFYFGGYFGGGFRINSPNKRATIDIMPLNINFGNDYFMESHLIIAIGIKF